MTDDPILETGYVYITGSQGNYPSRLQDRQDRKNAVGEMRRN